MAGRKVFYLISQLRTGIWQKLLRLKTFTQVQCIFASSNFACLGESWPLKSVESRWRISYNTIIQSTWWLPKWTFDSVPSTDWMIKLGWLENDTVEFILFCSFFIFFVSCHTFGIILNYITSKNWYWSFAQACLAKWELSIRLARPHMFSVVYMRLYQEWCNSSLLKRGEEWWVNTMYKG